MRTIAAALLIAFALCTGPVAAGEDQMTRMSDQLAAAGVLPGPAGSTVCPKGAPFIAEKTKLPLTCMPKGKACPAAYECIRGTNGITFQCCSMR